MKFYFWVSSPVSKLVQSYKLKFTSLQSPSSVSILFRHIPVHNKLSQVQWIAESTTWSRIQFLCKTDSLQDWSYNFSKQYLYVSDPKEWQYSV